MTCKCNDRINKALAEKNGRLAFGFAISRHESATKMKMISVLINVEKINSRGKKPPFVTATFCPFCGTKYDAED